MTPDALTFVVSGDDRERVAWWAARHTCRAEPDFAGGRLTYAFTPSGIGPSVRVQCACGAALDLTRVDTW